MLCVHQGAELYGSDRSFLSAVEALSAADVAVDVIIPADGELASELRKIQGVRIFFYGKGILRKRHLERPFFFLGDILRGVLFYISVFRRYPVIYINTVVVFSALVAAIFFRLSSKRIVCHVREIPVGWQLVFFRFFLRLSGVDLIFNSLATRKSFGLSGEVIYNGVASAKKKSGSEGVFVSESDAGKLNLLLIGRINEWKGQLFFVEALSAIPDNVIKKINVRIVGSPFEGYEYLWKQLQDKICLSGVGDVISLQGFCNDPSEHYLWADYVVVPSTRPEPFGRVAIEAFSYGKPVVAAGHGGLIEIVEDSVNGFIFEPGNVDSLAKTIVYISSLSSFQYSHLSASAFRSFEGSFSVQSYQGGIIRYFGLSSLL